MSLLDRQIILDTAHELYCVAVNSRWDEIGLKRPHDYQEFIAMVPRLDDCDQLSTMWRILGRVEQAWGYDVGLVFHHGEIDQNRGLYYLVMGCLGHGVSLADDFGEHMDKAAEILSHVSLGWPLKAFDLRPIDIEGTEWDDAARNAFPLMSECDVRRQEKSKYGTIVDEYVHGLTMHGGADEECGSVTEIGAWYGKVCPPLSIAIEDDQVHLTWDEKQFLKAARGGAIVCEDDQGFVSVEYYETEEKLNKAWTEIETDLAPDEDDEAMEDAAEGWDAID